MKRLLLAIGLGLIVVAPGVARADAISDHLLECARIHNQQGRLACFDGVAAMLKFAPGIRDLGPPRTGGLTETPTRHEGLTETPPSQNGGLTETPPTTPPPSQNGGLTETSDNPPPRPSVAVTPPPAPMPVTPGVAAPPLPATAPPIPLPSTPLVTPGNGPPSQ